MTLVLGVDSSTQSTKVVVVDAGTGRVVRSGRAPHPDGTEVPPSAWLSALRAASSGLLSGVSAMSVAGQQHGLVALDGAGAVVRPALLWNDTRSAAAAASLVSSRGASWWASAVGSVPVASFTVTKLAWLASAEPSSAARVESVLLPHDWLSWQLCAPGTVPFTDRSDASGTGYFSPSSGAWLPDLVASVLGRPASLPRVVAPSAQAALSPEGIPLAAGAGDNAAAALGLGLRPGDVVVSLGTSGTVFASVPSPVADPSGIVAGFCDAAGGYLPLVCTLNAARVLSATAALLGVSLAGLSDLALSAPPGAGGLVLLPYLDGERTPNLPSATGSLGGLTRTNLTPANLARAAVEGMLCGLADGVDALRAHGVAVDRILLVGGAAASPAVRAVAPAVFGAPVDVPVPAEYVALGAARQAAWMLSGASAPPDWPVPLEASVPLTADDGTVRAAYTSHRRAVFGV